MFNEIMNLDWKQVRPIYQPSIKLFLQEYMRRMVMWRDELKLGWDPFIDLAHHLDKDVRAPSKLIQKIKEKDFPNSLVQGSCKLMLHWSFIRLEKIQDYNIPDPFEPLLKYYQGGGSISRDPLGRLQIDTSKGMQDVCIIEPNYYRGKPPFVEPIDNILDSIDRQEKSEKS